MEFFIFSDNLLQSGKQCCRKELVTSLQIICVTAVEECDATGDHPCYCRLKHNFRLPLPNGRMLNWLAISAIHQKHLLKDPKCKKGNVFALFLGNV